MNKSQLLGWGAVLVFFLIATLLFKHHPSQSLQPIESSWLTYENTKYHYKLSYPVDGSAVNGNAEDHALDAEASTVDVRTRSSTLTIAVQLSAQDLAQINLPDAFREEYLSSVALDLKSFVIYQRNREIATIKDNSNLTSSTVSEIASTTIAGREAYGFTLNEYFENARPHSYYATLHYAFLNNQGDKVVVAYPANDPIAQRIVDSIQLTDGSSTPQVK